MIESRFFDRNPLTGASTMYHYDDVEKQSYMETTEDHQAVVDVNRRLDNDNTDANWRGDLHMVASLPLTVWFELKKNGTLDDDKRLRAWVNDSANSAFRVRPGKV